MNKEFVPYKQALDLKELGFNESCFRWYDERFGDDLHQDRYNTNKDLFMTDLDCSTPLYQQAFRWFRERYGIDVHIMKNDDAFIKKGGKNYVFFLHIFEGGDTYEEAELSCLKKLIEIVKNKPA